MVREEFLPLEARILGYQSRKYRAAIGQEILDGYKRVLR